ncbi:F-box/LRR-repeat protein At4g14103 isoform X2 [Physcomitrium patens]|uniref:F-box/LRR-repeat protein At4g14103 isoform X2 n=1 Tax=Physcomitrium patens TaxID=3218 RepID=UPI00024AF4D3|nr:F-box protein At1g10780-like isoform X1 [Physcomitrium patens]XP_024375176.1 F-box protein At1g10780-like isoform X1 [Physcomitrium patens]XP_024375177.1 F-box protein At1g10780-like isoform X1 [Physcomitrium patens]XP_024375178.1 F-box protein At1g10780-like isoform X1 [Physcomitrium patens]XP_024375179.1 F-box protein At1g10780-like isoform X1 [Physcomitrium patens]XP_024375180.1 F-box protein At1g10780-like isoform X1 [Physcomitrium patens]XP_024375182.1 F-box protein At1g10780-like iso|eukprot:XP_024375175.1 F-box protein At1g10780-like isoform X1 [Physcomitrella patens]
MSTAILRAASAESSVCNMGAMASFDVLPDSIACLILSKLENAQMVAQCAIVCHRWKMLARLVDTLTFESFKLLEKKLDKTRNATCLEKIVTQMLLMTHGIRVLKISYHPVVWPWIPNDYFSEDKVCQWLQHVNTSLERLTLVDPNRVKPQPMKLLHLTECKKLQWLNLCYGFIPEMPILPGRFEQLVTLHLDLIFICDSALQKLVELAPMLEDLKLNSCKGLRTPHLTAFKLKCLEFANDMDVATTPITVVAVNAPNLVTVSLCHVEELVIDGFTLQNLDLIWHVRPTIRELPVLENLHISGEAWALDSVTHLIRLGTNLRSLHIDAYFERKYPIQLQSLLRHLQELVSIHIGADFFECLQTAGGAGAAFMRMHAMTLPRLENIVVVIGCGNNDCISVIATLLKCAPALQTLRIDAGQLRKSMDNVMFFTNLLGLQRNYPQVKVSLVCPQTLV